MVELALTAAREANCSQDQQRQTEPHCQLLSGFVQSSKKLFSFFAHLSSPDESSMCACNTNSCSNCSKSRYARKAGDLHSPACRISFTVLPASLRSFQKKVFSEARQQLCTSALLLRTPAVSFPTENPHKQLFNKLEFLPVSFLPVTFLPNLRVHFLSVLPLFLKVVPRRVSAYPVTLLLSRSFFEFVL